MPIVHDPKTGQFSSSGSSSTGGGKSRGQLVQELQEKRHKAFLAKPGKAKSAAHAAAAKAEGTLRNHEGLSMRIKSLRQKVFTAPQGSTSRRRLEKQLAEATKAFEGTK